MDFGLSVAWTFKVFFWKLWMEPKRGLYHEEGDDLPRKGRSRV